jgi:hypothetical protein
MQSEHQDAGFLNSLAGQMTLLIGGAVVLVAFAWFYVF